MMKWLLLAVVIVAVLWWLGRNRGGVRAERRSQQAAPGESPSGPTPPSQPGPSPEAMVACAHCGLLLPQSDALPSPDGRERFCSEAHRQAGPAAK